MKITIFGLGGTGTSSVGKKLANELGYTFMSSGNIFRDMAKQNGLDVVAFGELCKTDSKFDIELDELVGKFGKENTNFIFESRLAWHFIPDSIKIKMVCDENERIRRITERTGKSLEEEKKNTILREKSNQERYTEYYDLGDINEDSNFDFIIDTTKISIDDVVKEIKNFIKNNK